MEALVIREGLIKEPSALSGEQDRKTSDEGPLALQAVAWCRVVFLTKYLQCV